MRTLILSLALLLGPVTAARAQVSVGVAIPGIEIGVHVPVFPELVLVPGQPVYYAPAADANYFFYDGLYWVYARDNWYASSWYDGPWRLVRPHRVPAYLLRVPVRYYRQPPPYFRDWRAERPPHWGEHWGRDWERRRAGWDRWDRSAQPRPAPLPAYQGRYSGDHYPRAPDQQRGIRSENYRHAPREAVTRQQLRAAPQPPPARQPEPRRMRPDEQRGRPQGDGARPRAPRPEERRRDSRGDERGEGRR